MTIRRVGATVVLTCDCHTDQTMAKIERGVLIIISKHHGHSHIVQASLDKLREASVASVVKSELWA